MRKRTQTRVAAVLAAVTLAWVLASCGGGGASSTATGSPAATAPPATSTASSAGSASRTVELSTCTSTAARARLSPLRKARYLTLCREAVRGEPGVAAVAARDCRQIVSQTVPVAAQAAIESSCPRP